MASLCTSLLRRRRRISGGNGLSVSAPSALLFEVGDQPITLDGANEISFADSKTDGSGDYTLTMSMTNSGTIDFDNTAYAAVTENSGADGSGTIDVTGTLAQINALFLPTAPVVDNFAAGEATISWTLTHSDGREISGTIYVGSVAALASTAIDDDTAVGTTIDTITALSGATYDASNSTAVYRPVISNIVVTEGETTADIDFDVLTPDNGDDPDDLNGDVWWIIDATQGQPSVAQIKAGQDSGGASAADSGTQAIGNTGHSAPEAQTTINATGLTVSTTYYLYMYAEMDNGVASRFAAEVSFTTDATTSSILIEGTTDALLIEGTSDKILIE